MRERDGGVYYHDFPHLTRSSNRRYAGGQIFGRSHPLSHQAPGTSEAANTDATRLRAEFDPGVTAQAVCRSKMG